MIVVFIVRLHLLNYIYTLLDRIEEMDSKLLLVESILLLYRESQLPDLTDRSVELIGEIEKLVDIPEATMETSTSRDVIISLKGTLVYMLEQPPSMKFEAEPLLRRLRINVSSETYIYDMIKDGMDDLEDEDQIKAECRNLRNTLRGHISKTKVKEIVKSASTDLLFNGGDVDWSSFVPTLLERLEPYARGIVQKHENSKMDELDLGNLQQMNDMFIEGQKEASSDGIMKLGWQGLNDMTGDHQGLRRGDTILIGALQHNFKSGMLMNIPKQVAIYNKPYMMESNKKPLILYISLENNISDNLMQIYAALRGVESGECVDTKVVETNVAAQYVRDKLGVNGYHFKMLRFNGSEFSYRDLIDVLEGYQEEGYEIHLVSLDYLLMMNLDGTSGSNEAFQRRDLLRRIRNYTNPKKITFITAAQLSTEAKKLVREGVECFVKEVANKGYYDGCKALDNEVDLEINIHIEIPGDGHSYLTMMRGKHRRPPPVTPEKDKYVVYRFEPYGLPEDINGKNLCRRSVGGGAVSDPDGGSAPWWG
jgi:hypothetical protein